MLSTKNLLGSYNSCKLSPKQIELFKVINELIFTQNVELDLLENHDLSNISPVFNISLIKQYFPNPIRLRGEKK